MNDELPGKLLAFVSERAGIAVDRLSTETPLFSDGLLDSMIVLEMAAFVEREAGVKFGPLDMNLQNMDSVAKLLRFVGAKQPG